MHRDRRIRIRGVRRSSPDLKKLSHALIELARAQIEAEAQADHQRGGDRRRASGDPPEAA